MWNDINVTVYIVTIISGSSSVFSDSSKSCSGNGEPEFYIDMWLSSTVGVPIFVK